MEGAAASWEASRPLALKPLGSINALLIAFLMRRFELGGQKWVGQLIHGFPIIGALSQDANYPINKKVSPPRQWGRMSSFTQCHSVSVRGQGVGAPPLGGTMGGSPPTTKGGLAS